MPRDPSQTGEPLWAALTRREWAKRIAGAILPAAAGWRTRAAGLSWEASFDPAVNLERRYRVDAQILILTVPLLRRAGVGAGNAAWREAADPDGAIRLLEFAAWSHPGRAAGLNRLGFFQERVRLAGAGMAEAIYFGLMTVSGEETAEEGRKALHPSAGNAAYSAVDARIQKHSMDTALAQFLAPAALSAGHRADLEDMARHALAGAPHQSVDFSPGGDPPPPFLHAMAELFRQPDQSEGCYIYNGRQYLLRLRRACDPKAGEHFRSRGLANGEIVEINGVLQRVTEGNPIDFRVWVEEGASHPIPLRIEYQPKSYLRLIFEAEA